MGADTGGKRGLTFPSLSVVSGAGWGMQEISVTNSFLTNALVGWFRVKGQQGQPVEIAL